MTRSVLPRNSSNQELVGNLSLFTNIYFLVTRKGTVCGIWAGE